MRALLLAGVAWASGLFLLAGCFVHPSFIQVHDNELTFDDYDSTVSYDAPTDAELADAPVDVHEFDESAASAAGAVKVIDSAAWFSASDFERNDMLNEVERDEPDSTTFVICVATGEVWKIPGDKFDAVSKIIDPWYGDEYDELDEYVGQNYAANQMTFGSFMKVAAIDPRPAGFQVDYLHDFGAAGRKEITSVGGFQVMPRQLWWMSSPRQRSVRLSAIGNYLRQLPEFQTANNAPSFGVTVPWAWSTRCRRPNSTTCSAAARSKAGPMPRSAACRWWATAPTVRSATKIFPS